MFPGTADFKNKSGILVGTDCQRSTKRDPQRCRLQSSPGQGIGKTRSAARAPFRLRSIIRTLFRNRFLPCIMIVRIHDQLHIMISGKRLHTFKPAQKFRLMNKIGIGVIENAISIFRKKVLHTGTGTGTAAHMQQEHGILQLPYVRRRCQCRNSPPHVSQCDTAGGSCPHGRCKWRSSDGASYL